MKYLVKGGKKGGRKGGREGREGGRGGGRERREIIVHQCSTKAVTYQSKECMLC